MYSCILVSSKKYLPYLIDFAQITIYRKMSPETSKVHVHMDKEVKQKREYAWDYFQLHAGQRMSTFNFFIILAALLTTALASTFVKDFEWDIVGFFLGSGLIIISFAFWKLDQRVRFLIKHAENALKDLENNYASSKEKLFVLEESMTEQRIKNKSLRFWEWNLSYSNSFGIVYITFATFGVLGVIGLKK